MENNDRKRCTRCIHFRACPYPPRDRQANYCADYLPQSERIGQWQKAGHAVKVFRCSLCEAVFADLLNGQENYHFCPNCGATME